MKIIQHLSSSEMLDLQLDSDCQALGRELAALRNWKCTESERSEDFWDRQGASIRNRIAEGTVSRHFLQSYACVGALALLLIVAIVLIGGAPLSAPTATVQNTPDPDEQLLMAVEQTVQSDVPEALAPASLLAGEISQSNDSVSQISTKETRDEN